MNRAHNKKRNVGIIFEQLVQLMSEALLVSNTKKVKQIVSLIRDHFHPGSELYKEFRLFNSLVRTRVENPAIANKIIVESQKASIEFNSQKLMRQKSLLIKDINHSFDEPNFYNRRIENYRDYATIQTLLNDWRAGSKNIGRVAKYEDEICKKLLSENAIVPDNTNTTPNHINPDIKVDALAIKLMTQKFNEKYSNSLNSEQARIIKEYAFGTQDDDVLRSKIDLIRKETLGELDKFVLQSQNQVLSEKIDEVRSRITSVEINNITDKTIAQLLTISKLKQTLLEE